MARRPMGIAGIQKKDQLNQAFKKQGEILNEAKLEHLQKSLETFRGHLEVFARRHKDAIKADPAFRTQFAEMCNKIGVDPLASSKGFWSELLGVGDYYFDLGVKIITIAIATRGVNGGIMDIDEVLARLEAQNTRAEVAMRKLGNIRKPTSTPKVSADDISKAIDKVSVLGSGLKLTNFGVRKVLMSVPHEMSQDQTIVLEFVADSRGTPISPAKIAKEFNWSIDRSTRVLVDLASETFAWYDGVSGEYWFPAFVPGGVVFEL